MNEKQKRAFMVWMEVNNNGILESDIRITHEPIENFLGACREYYSVTNGNDMAGEILKYQDGNLDEQDPLSESDAAHVKNVKTQIIRESQRQKGETRCDIYIAQFNGFCAVYF